MNNASLTSYALISIGEGAAVMLAFRYLMLGTVGAAFYLLSVWYLYSVTGSLNMADLATILPDLYQAHVVLVGFVFFVIGISIKMALFPVLANGQVQQDVSQAGGGAPALGYRTDLTGRAPYNSGLADVADDPAPVDHVVTRAQHNLVERHDHGALLGAVTHLDGGVDRDLLGQ